jgi:bifunctional ADP-heptose synthase (sugar kinase/adenylyltransferase)
MKNEKKEQFNDELSRLRKSFSDLNIDYKKGVLKTAQGLLRIQRKYDKPILAGDRGNR